MSKNIERFYEEWHKSALDNRVCELRDRDLMALDYLKDCQWVFELGCGSGIVLNMLEASIKAGADISEQAINIAEKIVHSSEKTDLRVVNIDNEDLHSFVYRLTKGHPLSLFLSTDLIQKGNFNTAEISTDLLKKKTEETLVMEFLVGTILKREADSSVKDALSSIPVFRIVNAQAIVEILDWDLSRAVDTIIKGVYGKRV